MSLTDPSPPLQNAQRYAYDCRRFILPACGRNGTVAKLILVIPPR